MNRKLLSLLSVFSLLMSANTMSAEEGNLSYDENTDSWGYPFVTVANSTQFHVSGRVEFAVCLQSTYVANAGQKWTDDERGLCLVTKVTATVATADGNVTAKPYTSTGTSFSNFAVIYRDGNYEVTRIIN